MSPSQKLTQLLTPFKPFLQKNTINQTNYEYIRAALELLPAVGLLIFHDGFTQPYYRVTINKRLPNNNNKRIDEISQLKYPPPKSVNKFGRANFQKQSVLYATVNHLTAFDEMQPEVGDLVTISEWELPAEKRIQVLPVFMITSGNDDVSHNSLSLDYKIAYINSTRHETEDSQAFLDTYLTFISECFAKPVQADNHYDYYLSSYFADKLFRYKNDNGPVEAIVYPSVKQNLSFSNIAIKPESFDSKFKLMKVQECVIRTAKPYFMDCVAETKKFDLEKNKILW